MKLLPDNLADLATHPKVVQILVETVDRLYARHQDTVSLVGWSVGGAFTRMAAFQTPNHIKTVPGPQDQRNGPRAA